MERNLRELIVLILIHSVDKQFPNISKGTQVERTDLDFSKVLLVVYRRPGEGFLV